MKEMVGIILAGGASRRFGSPKAFAEKEGKPFYQLSVEALESFTETIIIVTNDRLESKFSESQGHTLITDLEKYAGKGPLAGLYSAMEREKGNWYATAPVDVPFIDSKVYEELVKYIDQGKEAIIPVTDGKLQPLLALYSYSLKMRIKSLLESDRLAMRELFKMAEVQYVNFSEDKSFININHQTDYQRYIRNRG